MYLYKFFVQLANQNLPVIVVANNDEAAFDQVEVELEKHYTKLPSFEHITLTEKKKVKGRAAFVIEREE
ncbi:DUF3906 family protein [Bacillus kexueae]|uniref:DUF3906 family protein n=1 Tax=Aeribacillus kexueae TaxID=2078952 RepID=UPI001FAF771B|nr:DUF3906 family protein [Bacillus kexueae]